MSRLLARASFGSLLALPLLLSGCAASARLIGSPPADPPLPAGIELAFNHRATTTYRSPVSAQSRPGDDLEAMLLRAIRQADRELLVAVQELSLPEVAQALVAKQRSGVKVRVILENTYSTPWTQEHLLDLSPHQRLRQRQLEQHADKNRDGQLSPQERREGDAVAILLAGGVPLIDDTADGSAGSGLMHHKFVVVDRKLLVTGSANFTPSCIHGDPDDLRTRGNVNHLMRLESSDLASRFATEFERMWGDGPQGLPNSKFGLAKRLGGLQRSQVGNTAVEVLFSPHSRNDPNNGLSVLEEILATAQKRVDLALFVFSAQNIADRLAQLRARGVQIRLLADPGFANRSFSEVLDLLGISLPDRFCRIEAANRPWAVPVAAVGVPRLAGGDKLHHKLAVIDDRTVISGSFNWSPSAAHQNDETLLVIHSPELALQVRKELDRLWRGAEMGINRRLERKRLKLQRACGQGNPRPALQS